MSNVTLDQLRVLLGIVDSGGFSAAARAQRRTQGAVSYHVARLEEQVGAPLFDRSGRRPVLTEAGRAMARRAREVMRGLDGVHDTIAALQAEVEPELVVAADILFPPRAIASLLAAFEARFPGVHLTLQSGVWKEPVAAMLAGTAALAIAPAQLASEGISAHVCAEVSFVAVAAPGHPLAAMTGPIPVAEVHRHRRLVLATPGSVPADPTDAQRPTWRLTDGATRRGLVLEGVGWSRLPRFSVEDDLAAGRLVELDIAGWLGLAELKLAAMRVTRHRLGPAARWLFDHLAGRS